MKTYLVTGGAGFIGSNFIIFMLQKYEKIKIINLDVLTYAGNLENLTLVERDSRYSFVKIDIQNAEDISKVFRDNTIDYVVNFAAESHVDRSIENPNIFAETNIIGTINLLNAAKSSWSIGNDVYREGVKFLQVGTDEVYGDLPTDQPNIFFTEDTNIQPSSPYSASKASADLFVYAYHRTFKLPINITRCSNNYGPYQFPEKLIPIIINNALNYRNLPVYGDGMQVRDWLYVDDHCKAIDRVVSNGVSGETYNIGGHNEYPNIFIIKTILSYLHENVDSKVNESLITYIADRKGHDKRYAIDPKKIKDDLRWEPETMFKEGIIKTIRWYLDNKKWMEKVTSGEYHSYYEKMYKNK